ncbi:MAG: MBL fold metallo-hydrolase [Desulfurococcales archaeon]|nr:MBL fold metallo-hydrolase [Desulfurococcales archaeon]
MSAVDRLVRLGDSTYLLRGSPSTLFYVDDGVVYVVDPGHGSKRAKQIKRVLAELGGGAVAVVTHYHSDHFETLSKDTGVRKVYSSRLDRPGIEYPEYRVSMTFGLPLEEWREVLLYKPVAVKVDEAFNCGGQVGPLETLHLPGHTPGQVGVLTPDGILYAADAVFGERVLEAYLLPYHRDPCKARDSLAKLLGASFQVLVPGHGPVLEEGEGRELIQANMRVLDSFLSRLVESLEKPVSFEEILHRLVDDASKAGSPGAMFLVEQSLRGALACLAGRGLIEAGLEKRGVVWVKK